MLQRIFHPFDPFVLLFTVGMTFVGAFFLFKVIRWIEGLSTKDRDLMINGIFTAKTWKALGEVIRESLLHNKIFKVNTRLGYMHMSLAFGWFLLILLGNVESIYYTGRLFKPIYVSVFWRFFEPGPSFPQSAFTLGFAFWMDFFLLVVLSGLTLAILKRFRSRWLGMKRTTQQRPADRIALTALWLIFPIRLLAESATCGANGSGSFLTGSIGYLWSLMMNPEPLVLPLWWAYSFVLMSFFLALPFTRYFHIPSEPVLIFMRKYGIRMSKESPGYIDLSLRACSSCGICINSCQLADALPGRKIQSTYLVKSIRHHEPSDIQWDCMQCGRCEQSCPVGLELMPLRQIHRTDLSIGCQSRIIGQNGNNDVPVTGTNGKNSESAHRILYFAGCMTHLSPSIIRSMTKILDQSGSSWQFYDADGRACCGRPLKLAGQTDGAKRVRDQLQHDFLASGAELLVTSCPICYRTFNEDYDLPGIQVLHHTQFILQLIEWERIRIDKTQLAAVYHEPCELGRGSGITREPRALLAKLYDNDVTPDIEGLCCGGSLGGPGLDLATRRAVARSACNDLTAENPDVLITACPLCKKTFSPVAKIPVLDFAESVADHLIEVAAPPTIKKSKKNLYNQPVAVD